MSKPEMVSVGHIEIKRSDFSATINMAALPVLPTRNLVLFPGAIFPINLVRESSQRLAAYAEKESVAIAVVCQRDDAVNHPSVGDLFEYGAVAQILKVIELPGDHAIAMAMAHPMKIHVDGPAKSPVPEGIAIEATFVDEQKTRITDTFRTKLHMAETIMHELNENAPAPSQPAKAMIDGDMADIELKINAMCSAAPVPAVDRCEMLAANGLRRRLDCLITSLLREQEAAQIRQEIEEGARERMTQRQRNAILETQMEQIREELYGEGGEAADMRKKLVELTVSDDIRAAVEREIAKLDHLNPQSPDFQTQYAYLETVLELPWGKRSEDKADFNFAETELNATHSGLEKVKERVLEQLAMMMHSPQSHSPILCLVGPPGVGKTSLGQSIARAMGREFRRVSLGGMHDESEIRGHRRTYIGAMPGRIIDAIRRAGTVNPVIMLDEIDKMSQDYHGNPSAALLEVLDPEQNVKFHDNYIDLDFDLSNVLFITTANTLNPIEAPLLDRMEVISLSGYSSQEKMEIAREHLLPTLHKEMGLEPGEVAIGDEAISYIIDNYTSESGVRQLQKKLAAVLRKYIRAKVSGKPFALPVAPEALRELLGVETNSHDKYSTDSIPGVVTGLAWTAAGGEILFIEAVLTPGKGEGALTLTGNLGDVMKESAAIAHRYVKAHAKELGISEEQAKADVHIHVPEGAIPKDGPSAGITMTTAIVSAMTGRPVRERYAMTGEMTLRGKVLPVGGIKEKILAAKRAGITDIIICRENRRNVEEVKAEYIEGMTFHYVNNVSEVIASAL